MLKVLPLIKGLVTLESTAEIQPGNLRQAVMRVLMEHPALNKSKWNGGLCVNIRVERVGVILYHMRRLKQGEDLRMCAGKLTSLEFLHLQEVIDLMEKKDNEMHTLRKSVKCPWTAKATLLALEHHQQERMNTPCQRVPGK